MNELRKDRRMAGTIAVVVGLVVLMGLVLVLATSRRDIRAAHQAVDALGTHVIETACGPIEYLEMGAGEPVLVVHGIQGGVDQGIANVTGIIEDGYRRIFISRFGYLNSPMPDNATPEQQADLYACLLDTLGLQQVAVVAHSAGSTSAVQFALRHPERVSRLVLVSPNAPGRVEVSQPPRPVAEKLFRSDFIFWLITKHAPSSLYGLIGVPEGYALTGEERAYVNAVAASVMPVSRRAPGALFDMFHSNPAIGGYPLEQVTVPTMVVSAVDDPSALYQNAAALAERIPGAELVTIPGGGHLMLGSDEAVRAHVGAFLGGQTATAQ